MAYSRLLTLTCCYITWPCTPSQYYFSTVPHSIKVVISNWSRLEWICCNQSSLDPNNPINRNAEHSSQELKLSLWSTFPLTQTSPKATSTAVMIGRECPSISSLVCIPCQSFSIPANHRPSGLPQFAENSNYRHDKCWWSTILFIFFSWKGNFATAWPDWSVLKMTCSWHWQMFQQSFLQICLVTSQTGSKWFWHRHLAKSVQYFDWFLTLCMYRSVGNASVSFFTFLLSDSDMSFSSHIIPLSGLVSVMWTSKSHDDANILPSTESNRR